MWKRTEGCVERWAGLGLGIYYKPLSYDQDMPLSSRPREFHTCISADDLYFLGFALVVLTHTSSYPRFLQLQDDDSVILTCSGGPLEDVSIYVLCVSVCVSDCGCVRFYFYFVLQCRSADPAADPNWQVVG